MNAMLVVLLTAGVMLFAMAAMAVGVMLSGKTLKGSCGGVGNCACEAAGIPKRCEPPEEQIVTIGAMR